LAAFARDLGRASAWSKLRSPPRTLRGTEGDRQRDRIGADAQRHGAHRIAQLVADRTGAIERTIGEEDREAVAGQTAEHCIAAREMCLQRSRDCRRSPGRLPRSRADR
jgi:hypothetical protein